MADTSVLLNLCCVGYQQVLPQLFGDIFIPQQVREEFERAEKAYSRFAGLTVPRWARERSPRSVPATLRQSPNLDNGEIAAIGLAIEMMADAVLLAETEAREVARQHGLLVIGVLGVLVKARAKALVPAIAPIIDQLESKANFWIAQPSNGRSCGLQERKADRRQKLAAASRGQERWAVSLSS